MYNVKYIINFFASRGWKESRVGNKFIYFLPPDYLNLPEDFELALPNINTERHSLVKYVENLYSQISFLLPENTTKDDLDVFFSKSSAVLKYRIFDADNSDGTISFKKHIDSLDNFKKVLSNAVVFASTSKAIFGDAKVQVENYLNQCRALQTQKGSYVTRIEIPDETIYSSINKVESKEVNNKLFDVIEFVDHEVLSAKTQINVDAKYVETNSSYINYELLQSIKDIYTKSQINNIEYVLATNNSFRNIETLKVQARIKSYNIFLKELKNVLLAATPLEAVGFIRRLASQAPMHSKRNEVIIEAEISNSKESIKIILRSEEYLEAVDAHKNEWPIRIKGMARQGKSSLYIEDLEAFDVIKVK